jgi:hypothetical protein
MKATLLAVAPLLVAWTVGRFSDTLPSLSTAAFFGFSFLLVKAYTLAKDVSDELVPEPGFPRSTPQNRPMVDGSKPANGSPDALWLARCVAL